MGKVSGFSHFQTFYSPLSTGLAKYAVIMVMNMKIQILGYLVMKMTIYTIKTSIVHGENCKNNMNLAANLQTETT